MATTDTGYKTYSLRLEQRTIDALQALAMVKGVPAADLARSALNAFLNDTARDVLQYLEEENARREAAAQKFIELARTVTSERDVAVADSTTDSGDRLTPTGASTRKRK